MVHPIAQLQGSMVAALSADPALTSAIGTNAIFDAPPKGKKPPYLVIMRHELIPRDTDMAPGNDHRVHFQAWHPDPSRTAVLQLAERVQAVLSGTDLSTLTLKVTHARQERTDCAIDLKTGAARALMIFRIFSEPVL